MHTMLLKQRSAAKNQYYIKEDLVYELIRWIWQWLQQQFLYLDYPYPAALLRLWQWYPMRIEQQLRLLL